jgi:hypothetical protein
VGVAADRLDGAEQTNRHRRQECRAQGHTEKHEVRVNGNGRPREPVQFRYGDQRLVLAASDDDDASSEHAREWAALRARVRRVLGEAIEIPEKEN